jgi:hypothetical protein
MAAAAAVTPLSKLLAGGICTQIYCWAVPLIRTSQLRYSHMSCQKHLNSVRSLSHLVSYVGPPGCDARPTCHSWQKNTPPLSLTAFVTGCHAATCSSVHMPGVLGYLKHTAEGFLSSCPNNRHPATLPGQATAIHSTRLCWRTMFS